MYTQSLNGYSLTEEEVAACVELIKQRREEARKQAVYKEALNGFRYSVQMLIDAVGLPEAKQIIRQMNRELREL